ncbi:MAG TPA: hypothetical protein VKO67_08785, partial [Smithellaceae bacterium]|nr:hypothetical protein [Smithellaceae bacterium]
FFGTITALVPGPEAADYDYTSSLPVRILKLMAPKLLPMIEQAENRTTSAHLIQDDGNFFTQVQNSDDAFPK